MTRPTEDVLAEIDDVIEWHGSTDAATWTPDIADDETMPPPLDSYWDEGENYYSSVLSRALRGVPDLPVRSRLPPGDWTDIGYTTDGAWAIRTSRTETVWVELAVDVEAFRRVIANFSHFCDEWTAHFRQVTAETAARLSYAAWLGPNGWRPVDPATYTPPTVWPVYEPDWWTRASDRVIDVLTGPWRPASGDEIVAAYRARHGRTLVLPDPAPTTGPPTTLGTAPRGRSAPTAPASRARSRRRRTPQAGSIRSVSTRTQ